MSVDSKSRFLEVRDVWPNPCVLANPTERLINPQQLKTSDAVKRLILGIIYVITLNAGIGASLGAASGRILILFSDEALQLSIDPKVVVLSVQFGIILYAASTAIRKIAKTFLTCSDVIPLKRFLFDIT